MISQSFAKKRIDRALVEAEIKRIAPGTAWDGKTWNQLTLLGAAMAYNPKIGAARGHARSAEASARAAKVWPSMTLNLTAEYTGKAVESSPWLYGAITDIPLDIGAKRKARVKSANLAEIVARIDYADAIWTIRMALRRAMIDTLLTAREVSLGEELRTLRARQLAAMQARFDSGEVARADLERSRTDGTVDARRLEDAKARLISAHGALADAIGVPVQALADVQLYWNDFDGADITGVSPDDAQRAMALLLRADVLRAVIAYDQSETDLRGEIGKQWPEVHLGPGYTWERGLVKLPFTLGLALPPMDLNKSAIQSAEAKRLEAGRSLEAVVASATLSIDIATAERNAAVQGLAQIRSVDLPAAQAASMQADSEIDNGAIDRVDWSAAQVSLKLAELAQIDALRRLRSGDAALEDALRRPLHGPELANAQSSINGNQR